MQKDSQATGKMNVPRLTFSGVLLGFQIILLILYGLFVDYEKYDSTQSAISSYYPMFQDVHVMIFMGIGFLLTFLKRYGYSAAGYNMIIASVVIQWAMLVNSWVSHLAEGKSNPEKVTLNIKNLILADFTAGAVLISYCVVLGKTSRLQLILIAIFEVVFFAVNEMVLVHYLVVADVGGSLVIHLFGAYFGIAVDYVLRRDSTTEEENPKEASTKTSDLFSFLATIILWLYWPSFNGAMLGPGDQQQRAIINTYLSLAACCVSTFTLSPLLDKNYKLNMVHIQNATLAGGVAVGALANLQIKPWGAMLIGFVGGSISTLGYAYVSPFLRSKAGIHDTCGVNNLHGMPGIFSGVAAAIAAGVASVDDYGSDLYSIWSARAPKNGTGSFQSLSKMYSLPTTGKDRSKSAQAGIQLAAIVCAFAIAVVGGLFTGLVVKYLDNPSDGQLFDDKDFWLIPEEHAVEALMDDNQIEMKSKTSTDEV